MSKDVTINVRAPSISVDRCQLFDSSKMKIVFLDWSAGSPLTFYLKIPGGVPGLEIQISGDTQSWEYSAKIGDASTQSCRYEGYSERLYCSIQLPSGYANSIRPLTVSVNGCASPIYNNQSAFLPGTTGGSGGELACPAGQTYHAANSNWPGGCCSDGHWYIYGSDTEPGCWN